VAMFVIIIFGKYETIKIFGGKNMLSNIGVPGFVFFFNIIFIIIGIFILYKVIFTAVREGINKSVVGQFIEKKYGVKEVNKSNLDRDSDHNE
jgi:hypothetical protein